MPHGNDISRRQFLAATGAVDAVAIAGCTDDGTTNDGTSSGQGKPGEQSDKVYQKITGGVRTLDPVEATDIPAGEVIHNLFDALTNYPNGETTIELLLASDYESDSSGQTYTFHLKEGVTFTNGDEVTAQDFVYSFERLAYSENSNRKDFLLGFLGAKHETDSDGNYVANSLGVAAKDDYTFEVKLEKPFHAVLELIAYNTFAAVPEGIVGDVEGYDGEMSHDEFATKNPVGAGPYSLEKWEKDTELKIRSRPIDEYHGPGPYTAGTRWQVMEGTNAIYTYATRNTNADHPSVPSAEYDASKVTVEGTDDRGREHGTYGPLKNGLTADYYNLPILATYYVGFNCNNVEKAARQAWAYAYNREQINEQVSTGPSQPAYFYTPPALFPGGPNNYDEMKKEYPYGIAESRIEKAREVMEAAGYDENNKYEFTYTVGDYESTKKEGRIMRDKLASAHINLTIETDSLSTRFEKIANGSIDAYLLSWWADYPAADNFLQMLYPPNTQIDNPDSMNGYNWGGTDAANRAAEAWEKVQSNSAPTEEDQQARNDAYLEIEKARWEDLPVVTSNHYVTENYKYPWVDKPRAGAMGSTRQKHSKVRIEDRSEYM